MFSRCQWLWPNLIVVVVAVDDICVLFCLFCWYWSHMVVISCRQWPHQWGFVIIQLCTNIIFIVFLYWLIIVILFVIINLKLTISTIIIHVDILHVWKLYYLFHYCLLFLLTELVVLTYEVIRKYLVVYWYFSTPDVWW